MDPDEALRELRQKMDRMKSIIDQEERDTDDLLKVKDLADRIIDLWDGLDHWMSRAGALPQDWVKGRT